MFVKPSSAFVGKPSLVASSSGSAKKARYARLLPSTRKSSASRAGASFRSSSAPVRVFGDILRVCHLRRYFSVFRYAISSAICSLERIPPQCGMLTIGALPITLPLRITAAIFASVLNWCRKPWPERTGIVLSGESGFGTPPSPFGP